MLYVYVRVFTYQWNVPCMLLFMLFEDERHRKELPVSCVIFMRHKFIFVILPNKIYKGGD